MPSFVDPGFEQFLLEHKVEIQAVPINTGNWLGTLLFGFGPALFIIAFYVWLYRRAARQGGSIRAGCRWPTMPIWRTLLLQHPDYPAPI